jgi:hypothetical protein
MSPEERLKIFTAWDKEPALSQAEITELLAMFQKTDTNGVNPGGTGYVATYNLRAAAAEGWRWKLGKAAELQSTDLDGDRMSANQIFDHCQVMIKVYSRRTASPVTK